MFSLIPAITLCDVYYHFHLQTRKARSRKQPKQVLTASAGFPSPTLLSPLKYVSPEVQVFVAPVPGTVPFPQQLKLLRFEFNWHYSRLSSVNEVEKSKVFW